MPPEIVILKTMTSMAYVRSLVTNQTLQRIADQEVAALKHVPQQRLAPDLGEAFTKGLFGAFGHWPCEE